MSDGDNATHGGPVAPSSGSGYPDDHNPERRAALGAAPWERWQTLTRHSAADSGPIRRDLPRREPVDRTPSNDTADPAGPVRPGNHTSGRVTVAELIAKVGSPTPPTRHQPAEEADTPRRARTAPSPPGAPGTTRRAPEPEAEARTARLRRPNGVSATPPPPSRTRPDAVSPADAPVRPPRTAGEEDVWQSDQIARAAYAAELPDLDRIHRRRRPGRTTAGPGTSGATTPHPKSYLKSYVTSYLKPVRTRRPGAASSPPSRHPDGSGQHRALLAGRAFAALLAVVALLLTGGAWRWSASKNNSLNRVNALDLDSEDIRDANGQVGDENFLIIGADTRAGKNSDIGAGDEEDAEGSRSDTVMLVNIPANRKRVVVVSFPRDLAINPLWCQAWDANSGKYGPVYNPETGGYSDDYRYTETKLNSAYSLGGPKCLVKEIQKLSGLSINRFMAVDFVGFAKMVDALGGVEVCSTTPLYDYELGTVLDQSGRQVIDGSTALNYVRARSVETEINGDYGRIKRQQLFLSSLLRSLISSNTFFSPTKLNNVVNTFINDSYVDNVGTKDLVALGQSLRGVAAGHITFVTVPTSETDENGDEPPRMDDVDALFDAIINDDPLPGENDQNATSSPTTTSRTASTPSPAVQTGSAQVKAVTTAPGEVTLRVSNASDEVGLASRASDKFEQVGFNVQTPDDYPGTMTNTTVFFAPGNEQAAATVASALGNVPIERKAGMTSTVRVVLGEDFHSIRSPAPSGSTVTVQLTRGTSGTPTPLPEDLTVTNAADTTCE